MLLVLLTILKILGIFLLMLLGIILVLLGLVLFVPVRYRITAYRKMGEEPPLVADVKITWFFHIFNAAFSYPKAVFLKVRIFCFTIFRSNKPKEAPKPKKSKKEAVKKNIREESSNHNKEKQWETPKEKRPEAAQQEKQQKVTQQKKHQEKPQNEQLEYNPKKNKKRNKFFEFFSRLWSALKNIKYTITRICDKIKHIVKNLQYYIEIIKSDTFRRTWNVCSTQVFSLLKSILPKKIRGNLLIGTGDPAGTGQILAFYGILYPLLGNHIDVVPDFEQQILEGNLLIKGKITIFKALKTAWIIYFNKDLRRLIKLFKREAV